MHRSAPIERLVASLKRLPGIGEKSATRLAFHLLGATDESVRELAEAIARLKQDVVLCELCFDLTDRSPCEICRDERRDRTLLCVVEEPADLAAIERSGRFRGRYHVLGGAISPIDGIGPEELRIKELMARLTDGTVTELILATDPNLEGEATAAFLARLVKGMGLRVTRPASGLPVGGDLEYADEVTLGRAFEGRRLLDV